MLTEIAPQSPGYPLGQDRFIWLARLCLCEMENELFPRFDHVLSNHKSSKIAQADRMKAKEGDNQPIPILEGSRQRGKISLPLGCAHQLNALRDELLDWTQFCPLVVRRDCIAA
jgi:hypothetical protein